MMTPPGLALAPGHRVRWADGQILVESDDDRSRLRAALRRHLVVGDEGASLILGGRVRARLGATEPLEPLTAFEARFLADNNVPLPLPSGAPSFSPRTDLHTHFAGALPGRILLELAAEHGIAVPPWVLTQAGIHTNQEVSASELTMLARERLGRSLDVPLDRQVPASALVPVSVVAGGGRDPRDTDERWVRSHVFAVRMDKATPNGSSGSLVLGGSDAEAALFVAVERRPRLAFDHEELVTKALAALRALDPAT
jgi:hypothetical protein